jgi:hypothetical protein
MATYSQMPIRIDTGPSIFKLAAFAMASGAMLAAAGMAFGYWVLPDNRQSRAAERAPACAASAQRLLAADSLVALEREKYLLTAMDCDVWRQVRDLRQ